MNNDEEEEEDDDDDGDDDDNNYNDRPDIIIKNKKRKYAYRCGNTRRQKCCGKGSGKEVKIQQFMYRDKRNVEPEIYDYISNNWSHWNSNEKLKEKF